MTWRINALRVRNYKRAINVDVLPKADQHIVMIAGDNGSGKSSTLDALSRVLGGKREQAADPVHHGAKKAVIEAVLDDGKSHVLNVELEIKPGGESELSITDEHGTPMPAPQTVLNKIIGGRALDPLAFTMLPAKEQRATLLRLIDKKGEIAELEVKREKVFNNRTEVGRREDHARGELKRLPERAEVQPEIDPSALSAERAQLSEIKLEGEELASAANLATAAHDRAQADWKASEELLTRLEREIEEAKARLAEAKSKRVAIMETCTAAAEKAKAAAAAVEAARAEWRDKHAKRAAEIDADLARATSHNRAQAEAVIANRRRDEAEEVVAELSSQYRQQTGIIERFDAKKLEILKAAKLPVDGLSVDDAGILLNGAPFAQASSAEQLRVALALAIEAQPHLRDVWIKDASLLDQKSLQLVSDYALEKERTVWLEVVGPGQQGAIVITEGLSEGKVAP